MWDPVTVATLVLLLAGVVGSAVPMLPSGLLSLSGVVLYVVWGPTEVGPLLVAGFVVAGLLAAALEHVGSAIAARLSGTSTRTAVLAWSAGVLLFFVAGPVGLLVGVVGVVFLSELRRGSAPYAAARRAGYTLLGALGSAVAQGVLTLSILLGFVLFVL